MYETMSLLEMTKTEDQNVWDKTVKVEENGYYWKSEPIYQAAEVPTRGGPDVIEFFSGCGGTSLGFEMAGFNIAAGVDIHEPSLDTFRHNHPGSAYVLGDVRLVNSRRLIEVAGVGKPDVLIGGVPCQGFSLNNRKRHHDDERNFLYLEFVRHLKEIKPKVVILENVSGMRSALNGHFVKEIEREISEAAGMTVRSCLLNAAEYGVPQLRKRLIFVGIKGKHAFDFDRVLKTHGVGLKPFVTVKEAIGDLPSLMSGEEAFKYASEPFSEYQKVMRQGAPRTLTNHRAPNHPADTIAKIAATEPGKPMYQAFKQRIRLSWDNPSPTQVSGGIRPQFQFGHPQDSRGLTIRERCRLQSFPDSFFVKGGIVQGRVQTGNAVPPLLAKAIADALLKDYL